jgi:CubicO group peptidase (beta-lactamase class C family)
VLSLSIFGAVLGTIIAGCPSDPLEVMFGMYGGKQPGASVAVIKDGAVVYEQSFGLANLETGERAAPETNYRIASISKQFTAMSVLMLAERGSLTLDDPVTRHVPELAMARGVTLRHLLMHTSGLPEYEPLLVEKEGDQLVDKDVVALVAKHKLEFTPGSRYRYNNSGYAVLAIVVERVSKLSYGEFLKRNIFKPTGMTATQTYDPHVTIPKRAYGYKGTELFDQSRTTAVLGDGGIYSSARDLAHWVDALQHDKLIDAKRLAEATSPLVATDAPGISYGLGWKISDQNGERVAFHTGTSSGFKHVLMWVPTRKLAVIVLTNRRTGDPFTLGTLVLERFWNR